MPAGGVVGLIAVAGVAWGFARVLDAPRWTGRAILLATVLVMAASQLLLPPEAAFRQSVGGALRLLVILGIAAVPVLGYAFVLRRLRDRAAPVAKPLIGRVALVPQTAGLAADLSAALDAPPAESFGLIHRAPGGELCAGAVVTLDGRAALADPVWWRDEADGDTVIRPLIAAMGDEAANRGAASLSVTARAARIAQACRESGFAAEETPPGAPDRLWRALR